ncbi:MAG: hypothetical protein AAF633_07735 [Chloroflexota bacterium]
MVDQLKVNRGWAYLADNGLNMSAVFQLDQLPDDLTKMLNDAEVPLADHSRLVLLGNGGPHFWKKLDENGWQDEDPIDRFSLALTRNFVEMIGGAVDYHSYLNLYPLSSHVIPLQRLGALAGWGHPSPIGPFISGRYGLWFAYRSAFLTNLPLDSGSSEAHLPLPCDTCKDKPCQIVCPASAIQVGDPIALNACITHRLTPKSSCAATCLARIACPVGREHRYPKEVISRLYRHSLGGLRQWLT